MSNGFHEIITLFNSINLYDEIKVSFSDKGEDKFVYSYDEKIPYKPVLNWDNGNTMYRVWDEFKRRYDLSSSINIELKKHIPPQSGLGGSSSDAAALINLLGEKFELDYEQRLEIASLVGSDVSFLIKGGTAIGLEKGDILRQLDTLPEYKVLLIQPGFTFSTPEMYQQIDLMKFDDWEMLEDIENANDFEEDVPEENIKDEVLNDWEDDEVDAWNPYDEITRLHSNLLENESVLTFNDFEIAAQKSCDEYEEFRKMFYDIRSENILLKSMTGSGSAHFILFSDNADDKEIDNIMGSFIANGCWVKRTTLSSGEE